VKVRPHCIPFGGTEPEHVAAPSCWCFPESRRDPGAIADYVIHNARDGRDALNRDPSGGTGWFNVLEELRE
jgi:hypothetical protein